jgi:hypothetical protein
VDEPLQSSPLGVGDVEPVQLGRPPVGVAHQTGIGQAADQAVADQGVEEHATDYVAALSALSAAS